MSMKNCANCKDGIFLEENNNDMKCINVKSSKTAVKGYDKGCEYWN